MMEVSEEVGVMALSQNMRSRFKTAGKGIPPLLACLYLLPSLAWQLFGVIPVILGAYELSRMIWDHETELSSRHLPMVGLSLAVFGATIYGFSSASGLGLPLQGLLGMPIFLVATLLVCCLADPQSVTHDRLRAFGWLFGPLYVGGLMAFLFLLRNFGSAGAGAALTLLALSSAWASDAMAMLFGSKLGGAKLYPAVSPSKTWWGAFGGLVGSALGALALYCALHLISLTGFHCPVWSFWQGIGFALFAGAAGQVGDLCESVVKRATGAKDSGALLPGHGGILDRVDALLFTGLTLFVAMQFGLIDRFD